MVADHQNSGPAGTGVPPAVYKKIRQLEIRTRGIVTNLFAGEYRSNFKGSGMEFSEVREYQFGDDIRSIDWNVSARQGKPFIKVFQEEREQTLMLMIDASGSLWFGSKYPIKYDYAIELSAVLAFSAIKNNDKVGLCIFSDRIERLIPPRKGRTHVLRVLRELFAHQPSERPTNLAMAIDYVNRLLRRRSIVFLISDLEATGFDKSIRILNSKHDLITLLLRDMGELVPPPIGLTHLRDPETGTTQLVDLSSEKVRDRIREHYIRQHADTRDLLKKLQVDSVELFTNQDYVDKLMTFFRKRGKRY
ncbi:MAG: DUF58 domain-containing protein [Bacteroidetes bacterium]|nr:DUF58 domain-containing protein [Bacteroidota bacterium]